MYNVIVIGAHDLGEEGGGRHREEFKKCSNVSVRTDFLKVRLCLYF